MQIERCTNPAAPDATRTVEYSKSCVQAVELLASAYHSTRRYIAGCHRRSRDRVAGAGMSSSIGARLQSSERRRPRGGPNADAIAFGLAPPACPRGLAPPVPAVRLGLPRVRTLRPLSR